MLPSRGHARVRKSNCFFLKVLRQTKEADHEYRRLQKMPRRYRGSLGGVAGSTTTLSPPKKEQEISRENFDNHSIRGVVYFRHAPLSSRGKSAVRQLHNFIITEHAIASARRRDGGLDDNGRKLWSGSRLPVQTGNHKRQSQIPDGTRLQSCQHAGVGASARGLLCRYGHGQKQFRRWGFDFRCCVVRDPLACNRGPSSRYTNA